MAETKSPVFAMEIEYVRADESTLRPFSPGNWDRCVEAGVFVIPAIKPGWNARITATEKCDG